MTDAVHRFFETGEGLTIVSLKLDADFKEEEHPREKGKFAFKPGKGGKGGGKKAPGEKLKHFEPSVDKDAHLTRVAALINLGPKRNSLYRWQVNKFIDEAKEYGTSGPVVAKLQNLVAQSFAMQGALLLNKGKTDEGQALINSAKKKGLSQDEINEIIWPGGKPKPTQATATAELPSLAPSTTPLPSAAEKYLQGQAELEKIKKPVEAALAQEALENEPTTASQAIAKAKMLFTQGYHGESMAAIKQAIGFGMKGPSLVYALGPKLQEAYAKSLEGGVKLENVKMMPSAAGSAQAAINTIISKFNESKHAAPSFATETLQKEVSKALVAAQAPNWQQLYVNWLEANWAGEEVKKAPLYTSLKTQLALDPPKPASALTELQKKAQSVAPLNVNRFVAPSHPARAEAEKLVNEFNAKYAGINKPVLTDPAALDKKIADYEQLQKSIQSAKDNSAAKQKAEFEKQFASPDDAAAFGVISNVVSGDTNPMQYVSMVKEKAGKKLAALNISVVQASLVHAYTQSYYRHMNLELREGSMEPKNFEFMQALNKTLSKMPKYVGEVYRKVPDLKKEVFLKYKPGKIVPEPGFTSASTDQGVWSGDYRYVIQSKTGVNVQPVSAHYHEKEVLFRAHTYFKIDKVVGQTVYMTEMDLL